MFSRLVMFVVVLVLYVMFMLFCFEGLVFVYVGLVGVLEDYVVFFFDGVGVFGVVLEF